MGTKRKRKKNKLKAALNFGNVGGNQSAQKRMGKFLGPADRQSLKTPLVDTGRGFQGPVLPNIFLPASDLYQKGKGTVYTKPAPGGNFNQGLGGRTGRVWGWNGEGDYGDTIKRTGGVGREEINSQFMADDDFIYVNMESPGDTFIYNPVIPYPQQQRQFLTDEDNLAFPSRLEWNLPTRIDQPYAAYYPDRDEGAPGYYEESNDNPMIKRESAFLHRIEHPGGFSDPGQQPDTTKASVDLTKFKMAKDAIDKSNKIPATAMTNSLKTKEEIDLLASIEGEPSAIDPDFKRALAGLKTFKPSNKTKDFADNVARKHNQKYVHSPDHLISGKRYPNYKDGIHERLKQDGYNRRGSTPNSSSARIAFENEDLVPLVFHDIVNKKYIPFRSFINTLSDTSDATWDEVQYVGRADAVQIYKGFTRSMTLDFSVVAFSVEELHPMWERINYMVGLTQPAGYTDHLSSDYTHRPYLAGFIIPPMLKLNLGDLYKNQPVVLTNIGVTIPNEAGWETTSQRQSAAYATYDYEFFNEAIRRGLGRENTDTQTQERVFVAQLPSTAQISISLKFLAKRLPKTGNRHFADSVEEHGTQMVGYESKPDATLGMGHNLIHPPKDQWPAEGDLPRWDKGMDITKDDPRVKAAGSRFYLPGPFETTNPPKPEFCYPQVEERGALDAYDRPLGPPGTSAADHQVALARNQKRWVVDVMIWIASQNDKFEPPVPFPTNLTPEAAISLVKWVKVKQTGTSTGGVIHHDPHMSDTDDDTPEYGTIVLEYEGYQYNDHTLAFVDGHPKYYDPKIKQHPDSTTGAPYYIEGEIDYEIGGANFGDIPGCLGDKPQEEFSLQEIPFMPPECVYVINPKNPSFVYAKESPGYPNPKDETELIGQVVEQKDFLGRSNIDPLGRDFSSSYFQGGSGQGNQHRLDYARNTRRWVGDVARFLAYKIGKPQPTGNGKKLDGYTWEVQGKRLMFDSLGHPETYDGDHISGTWSRYFDIDLECSFKDAEMPLPCPPAPNKINELDARVPQEQIDALEQDRHAPASIREQGAKRWRELVGRYIINQMKRENPDLPQILSNYPKSRDLYREGYYNVQEYYEDPLKGMLVYWSISPPHPVKLKWTQTSASTGKMYIIPTELSTSFNAIPGCEGDVYARVHKPCPCPYRVGEVGSEWGPQKAGRDDGKVDPASTAPEEPEGVHEWYPIFFEGADNVPSVHEDHITQPPQFPPDNTTATTETWKQDVVRYLDRERLPTETPGQRGTRWDYPIPTEQYHGGYRGVESGSTWKPAPEKYGLGPGFFTIYSIGDNSPLGRLVVYEDYPHKNWLYWKGEDPDAFERTAELYDGHFIYPNPEAQGGVENLGCPDRPVRSPILLDGWNHDPQKPTEKENNQSLVTHWMNEVEKWVACERGPPPEDYNNFPEFESEWKDGRLVSINWPIEDTGPRPVDPAWINYFCTNCDESGEPPPPPPLPPTDCLPILEYKGLNVAHGVMKYLEDYPGYCPNHSLTAKSHWQQAIANFIACNWSNEKGIAHPTEGDNVNLFWKADADRPQYVRWPKDSSTAQLREQYDWINAKWSEWGFGIENPATRKGQMKYDGSGFMPGMEGEPSLDDRNIDDLDSMDYWDRNKDYGRFVQDWAPCGEYAEVFHNDQYWRANTDFVPAGKEPGSAESMPAAYIVADPDGCHVGTPDGYHTWWWTSFTNLELEAKCRETPF